MKMSMSFEQIRECAQGAARVVQEPDGIHFYRFTEEQKAYYATTQFANPPKHLATAGVRLVFRTNSRQLGLAVSVSAGSSRKFFAFDILVNGSRIGYLGNFTEEEKLVNYFAMDGRDGEFEGVWELPEGEKEVCIHFPYTKQGVLKELTLEEGAFVQPVKRAKKLITFGDSITHGYDALHPSERYAGRLADALDAEEICKAIGGEIFQPVLAAMKDDFTPDYITVAYGTNDWSHRTPEEFLVNCDGFYGNLVKAYPGVPIVALTPIWRKDHTEGRPDGCGEFSAIEEMIRKVTAKYPQITCISARHAVPEDERLLGDLRLHPSDEGFRYYYEGIVGPVLKALKQDQE